eukprot:scaffold4286_cov92-Amphora_coffeaeformis.AAC.5
MKKRLSFFGSNKNVQANAPKQPGRRGSVDYYYYANICKNTSNHGNDKQAPRPPTRRQSQDGSTIEDHAHAIVVHKDNCHQKAPASPQTRRGSFWGGRRFSNGGNNHHS